MQELKRYIEETKSGIIAMTELFYQQNVQEALNKMPNVLDGIEKIYVLINDVDCIEAEDKTSIVRILGEAMNAMESGDYVLLADILQYDMIDILELYINKLN